MKPSSTLFLALAMLAAPATAANVCVEFLEQHPGDSGWQQACLGWLETQQPGSSPASSGPQAGGAGGASASMSGGIEADAPVHVSASNPMLAEGNQNEAFIAVDPSNPMRIFTISKTAPFTEGLLAAYSTDGGSTWHPSTLGDDGDEEGEGDPWAVFTDQGTLFVSYLDGDPTTLRTVVLQSNDGGATFEAPPVAEVGSFVDRGSLATGPAGPAAPGATGSLWTTYLQAGTRIVVEGAALDAGGSPIEDFCGMGTGVFCVKEPNVAEGDATGAVRAGHIAVGPGGEVLVTYMRLDAATPRAGPTRIFAELDPDGLGPALFSPVPASGAPVLTTNVGFFEREFPPHEDRFITPLANLAWYRGSGRIYLASTIEDPVVKEETDIVLLHSDDDGMSWSDPWQVNQDSTGEVRSQFFPHVAVDETTGTVAVAWHDPRNDDGGSDGFDNTETDVFAAISADGRFFHEIVVSDGLSRATSRETSHGDYLGVAFHDDNIHVAWVDNSRDPASTPPECDPVPCMDAYTARIPLPEPDPGVSLLVGGAVLSCLSRRRRALHQRAIASHQ